MEMNVSVKMMPSWYYLKLTMNKVLYWKICDFFSAVGKVEVPFTASQFNDLENRSWSET